MADIKPHRQTYLPNIRDYHLWELERIAQSYFDKLQNYIQLYRVDVELFMDKELNLRVESYTDLRKNHSIYAFTVVNSNYLFADADLLDSPSQEKKLRFTIAEERAHFLIHKDLYGACQTPEARIKIDNALSDIKKRYIESNARALAGMFLLPKNLVDKKIAEIIDSGTLTTDAPLIDQLADQIQHDFDVNYRCAHSRLRTLGYQNRSLE